MLPEVDGYLTRSRRRRTWKKLVSILACVVVFCTTYALILPAITLEEAPVCGKPEHTHREACYTQVTSCVREELVCSPEQLNLHQHTAGCFDENGVSVCGYANFVVHTHDASCYDADGKLRCPLLEVQAHTHSEPCYAQPVPAEAHTHTEAFYTIERGELICGQMEAILHTHDASCFDASGSLICDKTQVLEHTHNQECFQTVEEPVDTEALTCTIPEGEGAHTHSVEAKCYDENGALICRLKESSGHQHAPLCYGAWELTCTLEEHTHTEACFTADGQAMENLELPVEASLYTDGSYSQRLEGEMRILLSGQLPEDVEAKAYPVSVKIEGSQVLCAYDIRLFCHGAVYEPEQKVSVKICVPALGDADRAEKANVYYIPEAGRPEALEGETDAAGISFKTGHFSVYAVAVPNSIEDDRFYVNSGNTKDTSKSNAYYMYEMGYYLTLTSGQSVNVTALALGHQYHDPYEGVLQYQNVPWKGDGSDNYEVTYCVQPTKAVVPVARDNNHYYIRSPLAEYEEYTTDQKRHLQFIMENSYPYISANEMRARIKDGKQYTTAELLTATQLAIWETLGHGTLSSISAIGSPLNVVLKKDVPAYSPQSTKPNIEAICAFLKSGTSFPDGSGVESVSMTDTGYEFVKNEDGTYGVDVTVTLSREVTQAEHITATLSDGANTVPAVPVATENRQFHVLLGSLSDAAVELKLSLNNVPATKMQVYVYDSQNYTSQRMIGATPSSGAAVVEKVIPLEREKIAVRVEKQWDGDVKADRPRSVQLQLYADGQPCGVPVALDAGMKWQYIWENLPKTKSIFDTREIAYTVEETEVPAGYYSKVTGDMTSGFTVTNTKVETSSVSVKNCWAGELNKGETCPERVVVRLLANGAECGRVTLSEENNWFWYWDELPKVDDQGNKITYTVKEDELPGYKVKIEEGVPTGGSGDSTVETLTWEKAESLEDGKAYLLTFQTDGMLALSGSHGLTKSPLNTTDPPKGAIWTAHQKDSGFQLTNGETGEAMDFCFGNMASVGESGYPSITNTLSFQSGKLFGGGNKNIYYFKGINSNNSLGETSINAHDAIILTLYEQKQTKAGPDYGETHFTVTNTRTRSPASAYELPATGGPGITSYTIGGLLIIGAGFLLLYNNHRRRGGDCTAY